MYSYYVGGVMVVGVVGDDELWFGFVFEVVLIDLIM